jgi:NAD(P)H-flavin reductase
MTTGPMTPTRYRVVENARELADTVTLTLEPVDEPLPASRAGQFNMVWAFGVGEVPISISGEPSGEVGSQVHTIRAVGATTRALCDARPGTVLGLRGPFGSHWDVAGAAGRDVVIVGGGIGLAPVRSALLEVLADRDRFGHVSVLIGARTPADLLYADQLRQWRGRLDLEVLVTVDAAPNDWHGEVGVVTRLIDRAGFDPARSTAFICGPEIMMRFTAQGLIDRGMEPTDIRVSLERNMQCAIAQCGHCQVGPVFVCREGPVFDWVTARSLLTVRER